MYIFAATHTPPLLEQPFVPGHINALQQELAGLQYNLDLIHAGTQQV